MSVRTCASLKEKKSERGKEVMTQFIESIDKPQESMISRTTWENGGAANVGKY